MLTTRGGRLVAAASVAAVCVLLAAGWASREAALALQRSNAWVAHSRDVDLTLERLLSALRDAETSERGYLLVGEPAYLEPYNAALPRIDAELSRLVALTRDNPVQAQRIPELQSLTQQRLQRLTRGVELRRNSLTAALGIVTSGEGRRLMDAVRDRVAVMQATEAQLAKVRQREVERARRLSNDAVMTTTLLAIVLLILLVSFSRRDAARLQRSEARLTAIFGSIGDAVIATDPDGRIERMNKAAEALTGWQAEEAQGRALQDVFVIVNETTGTIVENPVQKIIRLGSVVGLAHHTVLLARDGRRLPIEDSAAPIGDDRHGDNGIVLVFRDESKDRELQEARAQSEARFRQIADGMPQIAYVANGKGDIVYLNQRWRDYTGESANVPSDFDAHIHPQDRATLAGAWRQAQNEQRPLEASIRLRSREDEWRWFLTRAVPLRDVQSDELNWYGTSTDIHDQVVARDILAEQDQRKDAFVATLAHELRNPLAPIRSAAHVLLNNAAQEKTRRWAAQVIDRQVRIMATLLDDLLDVARVSRGTLDLQKQPVSLRTVVETAVETAQPLIESRNHELSLQLPDAEVLFDADPVRMTQVLANLLTNAAKYMEPGGHVAVSAGTTADEVWFAVRDDGIGLESEALEYIFELFAQVPSTREHAQGGLGIGLALVKGLVELHGGSVQARSEGSGRGSEFRVTLPRGAVPATPREAAPATLQPLLAAPRALRVLVADDNVDGAESLLTVLQLHGYDAAMAHDGPAALHLADRFAPDVAIVDIGMPGLDGYEVAQRLRQRSWAEDLLLIALTGWGQQSDREQAGRAGFDHHLVKPVEIDALLRWIATHRSRARGAGLR